MTALRQAYALARRSVLSTLRQPSVYLPALFFPLLIAAVNSAAVGRATDLPNFPYEVDSFLTFLLPATIVQGVMFGAVSSGSDIALDIQDGFFERLLASPVWRPSILVGRLSGGAVMGGLQAIVFMVVLVAFGAEIKGGIPAAVAIVAVAMVVGIAIGGVTAAIGVRSGSQETVQNMFPLIFILLFLSSAFFPTELMNGWYKAVAEHNPITLMIDPVRRLVVEGFSVADVAEALLVAGVFAVITVSLATWQLRQRLSRAA